MKVGVRVNGGGFERADSLVADVRRRAVARLEAEIEAQRESERRERDHERLTRR